MKNQRLHKLLLPILLLASGIMSAQVDTSISKLTFSGYAEVYYTFDFNQPGNHNRPSFIYSHNRHNEFNLNLGFVKSSYTTDRVRANVAIASGTYINANYAAEPGVLKNVYEANAGVKLSWRKNIWLDAGIFASHIGFESAVSKDCRSLTRSMLADNSPYYESGAKLTYISDNTKWLLCGLLLNGWQHIQRPDGNNTPAFGTQISFTPNSKTILNYSTFIGNEKPDTAIQMRYFHNFYGMFHITNRLHVTGGFDVGMEQKSKGSNNYNYWYSPVLIVQFNLNNRWSITARGEYFVDENAVIIAAGNGFRTAGYSVNLDCTLRENAVWRIEGRTLNSKDKIFSHENKTVNTNTFVTTSLAISF